MAASMRTLVTLMVLVGYRIDSYKKDFNKPMRLWHFNSLLLMRRECVLNIMNANFALQKPASQKWSQIVTDHGIADRQ